jgi:mannose-6-phosphate isomerase-like protein (cupin superfamily)
VLIPAGVEHEFRNPTDVNVEGLILMSGKGA